MRKVSNLKSLWWWWCVGVGCRRDEEGFRSEIAVAVAVVRWRWCGCRRDEEDDRMGVFFFKWSKTSLMADQIARTTSVNVRTYHRSF
ncbi:hypothetical protein L1987_79740 [Smallanthus sonchifolius]|uniref:Uncharacterized protein n=1 Tax=Smallanthus sonchifolius TaxID=185202 RepID=A0ACB8YLX2_9ASTR|nr:hypothetical protein L1987_79740 [Smallanthus sonchifolius]